MDTSVNSPVQLIQELLALLTTRDEVLDTLGSALAGDSGLSDNLQMAKRQTQQFSRELLDELSGFGDAVTSEVDRRNPYDTAWKDAKADAGQIDGKRSQTLWDRLEQVFAQSFTQIVNESSGLPESLQKVVSRQMQAFPGNS